MTLLQKKRYRDRDPVKLRAYWTERAESIRRVLPCLSPPRREAWKRELARCENVLKRLGGAK